MGYRVKMARGWFGSAFPKLTWLANGFLPTSESVLPVPFLIFMVLAAIVALFLHLTPYGRHLFALGANEEAARFSGIQTHRLKILSYVLCSLITGIAALL